MENAHHVPTWVKILPVVLTAGVGFAVFLWLFDLNAVKNCCIFRPLYVLFSTNGILTNFMTRPLSVRQYDWSISLAAGDQDTIDGFGPDGMSAFVYRLSGVFSRIQTGFVFHYAFAMLIGVVVMVTWYYFRFMGA